MTTADPPTPLPGTPSDIPGQVTQKKRGRPAGGLREEARQHGVPEATYRRQCNARFVADCLRHWPTAQAAIDAAPAPLSAAARFRIARYATATATEAEVLAAVAAEIAAQASRPPGEIDQLRERVTVLEAENEQLRRWLYAAVFMKSNSEKFAVLPGDMRCSRDTEFEADCQPVLD